MSESYRYERGGWARDDGTMLDEHVRVSVERFCSDEQLGRVSGLKKCGSFAAEVVDVGIDAGAIGVGERVCGFGPHAETLALPARMIHPVPRGVASEAAALLPPLSVAAHAARLARLSQASTVRFTESGAFVEFLRAACKALGVIRMESMRGGSHAQPAQEDPGINDDLVVFETTGDPKAIVELFGTLPRLARIVLAASTQGRKVDVDFYRTVHQRGLELIGVSDLGPFDPSRSGSAAHADLEAGARLLSANSERWLAQCRPVAV